MQVTDTIVIGGGQAGLAASYHLTAHGHHHVVLERGRVGQRWRTGVWDSLRMLSPNWINALPGWGYHGTDPDGYAPAVDFAANLDGYAASFGAPVIEGAAAQNLRPVRERFEVTTPVGSWRARHVIIATGWCDLPLVPDLARNLDAHIHQVTANEYRNPHSLPAGGVLVVGASATGVQLADELHGAGRPVTLAIGRHRRMPRLYRSKDIFWWLQRLGMLDTTIDAVHDPGQAPFEPSLQVSGRPDQRTVDLATLQSEGVRLLGRVTAADGHRIRLSSDLPTLLGDVDRRLRRFLCAIDAHIEAVGNEDDLPPAAPYAQVALPRRREELDLRRAGIRTVIWATGHRRVYPWLDAPVLDARGEIRQQHGVTPIPGMYILGQRFQHYRSSSWVCGVGRDAAHVTDHILSKRLCRSHHV